MNQLQIFTNEQFGSLRTVETADGVYFVGKDVCEMFGDKNHNRSIGRIDDEDKAIVPIIDKLGRTQNVTIINESGLYALLFAMQPQKAHNGGVSDEYPIEVQQRIEKLRKFKRWVTSEVLPSLRKTGSYSVPVENQIAVKLLTITPEMASEMLKKNIGNRKLNQVAVNRLAQDIAIGKWAVNGTSIKFYQDGTLADGQTRLSACVKAGVPFTTYVITGLDKEVLPTIDCGRPRSLVDALNMTGCNIQKKLVPAMNLYFAKGNKLTANQAAILWNEYQDKFLALCDILAGGHHDHILSQASLRSFLIHLAINEEWKIKDIENFVNGLKEKPNRDTAYEISCYNFRNFYDRKIQGKLYDNKSFGKKTKTAVVVDALNTLSESYKYGKVIKAFLWRDKADKILDTGKQIADIKFAFLQVNTKRQLKMG